MNETELKEIDELATGIVEGYRKRIKELESQLKLNASMLAHQTDLAREAETKAMGLESQLKPCDDAGVKEIEKRLLKTPFVSKQSRDDVHYLLSYLRRGTCCNLLCQAEKLQFEQSMIDWKRDWQLEMAHSTQLEKRIEELEANELRFPTLAEFSNLQEDYERVKIEKQIFERASLDGDDRIDELKAGVKELEFNFQEMLNVASDQTEAYRTEHKRVKELEEGIKDFLADYKPYYDAGLGGPGIRIYEKLKKLIEKGETE